MNGLEDAEMAGRDHAERTRGSIYEEGKTQRLPLLFSVNGGGIEVQNPCGI